MCKSFPMLLLMCEHYEKSIKIGKEATKIRNILNIDIICEKWLNFVQYVIKEEKN